MPGREKGHLVSKETRIKISNSLKKTYQQNPETKERISMFPKGHIPWNKGISYSEEQKEKLRGRISWIKGLTKETDKRVEGISKSNKGRKYPNGKKRGPLSEETKRKISEANKGKPGTNLGKHFSEEHRKNLSESLKGKPSSMLGKYHSEETKKQMSCAAIKRNRENMAYWANLHKSLHLKPNKPEAQLNKILQKLRPNEYKYVGDFSFILGGKSPDFMNINGKKKLIELFGDYWHKDDDPQERIDFFKQYGFDTLIVWEKELKDNKNLLVKLGSFVN